MRGSALDWNDLNKRDGNDYVAEVSQEIGKGESAWGGVDQSLNKQG